MNSNTNQYEYAGGETRGCASLGLSNIFSCVHEHIIEDNSKLLLVEDDATANKLIAQEMAEIPANERERILEEIHGVYSKPAIEETKEMIQESLDELAKELSLIRKKPDYDRAVFLAPQYVKNEKFRLMFLRADRFDCKKAARRLVKHFEVKRYLWGEEKLGRDITLKDFSKEDMECLMDGSFQVIPSDSVGRPVFFLAPQYIQNCNNFQTCFRIFWYLFMNIVLYNEEAQTLGIICVNYFMGSPFKIPTFLIDCTFNVHMIRDPLPYRAAALHNCANSDVVRKFDFLGRLAIGKEWRMRFRLHYGSHLECQHTLMGFGISPETLPVDANGKMKSAQFEKFVIELRSREEKEEKATTTVKDSNSSNDTSKSPSTTTILSVNAAICVKEHDVLLGRGKPFQSFSGNLVMMDLVEQKLQAYIEAPCAPRRKRSYSSSSRRNKKNRRNAPAFLAGHDHRYDNDDDHYNGIDKNNIETQENTEVPGGGRQLFFMKSKSDILMDVISEIRARGGRFLQRVPISTTCSNSCGKKNEKGGRSSSNCTTTPEEYWIEVSDVDAYGKVGHYFRSRIRGMKNNNGESASVASPSQELEGMHGNSGQEDDEDDDTVEVEQSDADEEGDTHSVKEEKADKKKL